MNSYTFVNDVEIYKFKVKNSKINLAPLHLGNISKDFSVDDMRKAGLYEYVYDFPVDYDSIDDDNILDIHEYLTHCTKNHIFFSKYSEMMVFPKNCAGI